MKVCWCTLRVDDIEASKKFYGDILGLKLEHSFSPSPGMEIAFYSGENSAQIELIYSEGKQLEASESKVSIGFTTDNLEKELEKMAACGVEILRGPLTLGKDTRCFFVKDPNGIEIQIVQATA